MYRVHTRVRVIPWLICDPRVQGSRAVYSESQLLRQLTLSAAVSRLSAASGSGQSTLLTVTPVSLIDE